MSNSPTPRSSHRTPSGRRSRRFAQRRRALREVGYLAGLLLASGLAYYVLILLPSRLQTEELREHHDRTAAEVRAIDAEVRRLSRETAALEGDAWAVERALRTRMGYLKPGERVFRSE
jgi:cell division protein FtsB